MRSLILTLALMAVGATHAAQEFHKWTDENGVVHYTAEPPPDAVQAETVKVSGQPRADGGAQDDGQLAENADEMPAPDPVADRARLCAEIADQIARLDGQDVTAIKNTDGTLTWMDAEATARHVAKLRDQQRAECASV